MQIEEHVQALREDLARIAAVGDDATKRAAELLADALEPSFARRIQEALAESALELSAELEVGRIEVRLVGNDPELIFVPEEPAAEDATGEAPEARITLRLPRSLKSRIEVAATREGVSVNTWLIKALHHASEPRHRHGGSKRRLTGFGRS